MAISRAKVNFRRLNSEEIMEWSHIPTCIAGDCMNRQNIMAERISSIKNDTPLCGQARTVSITQGDNSAIHAALTLIEKGDVLVVEGGGFVDRAVWGELMNRSSISLGLGGVIIDGSVRDISELRKMSLPVFAAGYTPAGPTKGGGGKIDIPISCGNVSVKPGDIVIGDDDGIAVIPLDISDKILTKSKEKIIAENEIILKINNGLEHKEVFNVNKIPFISEDID